MYKILFPQSIQSIAEFNIFNYYRIDICMYAFLFTLTIYSVFVEIILYLFNYISFRNFKLFQYFEYFIITFLIHRIKRFTQLYFLTCKLIKICQNTLFLMWTLFLDLVTLIYKLLYSVKWNHLDKILVSTFTIRM